MTSWRPLIVCMIACSILLGTAGFQDLAAAESGDEDGGATIVRSRVPQRKALKVRNKFFYKKGRLEITPQWAYVTNNSLNNEMLAGLALTYHFSERIGLEFSGMYGFLGGAGENGNTNSLAKAILIKTPETCCLESVDTGALMMLSLVWSPMYGKLNPFGLAVINLDFYFLLGVGYGNETIEMLDDELVSNPDGTERHIARLVIEPALNHLLMFNFAFGAKIFASRWFSLKLEGRLYLTFDQVLDYSDGDNAKDNRGLDDLVNRLWCHDGFKKDQQARCVTAFPSTFTLGVGGSFWVPGQKAALRNVTKR